MADRSQWRLGDGVRQRDRLPGALADGYFRADERDFATLLARLPQMAERLRFIDAHNRPDGSWHRLFAREDAVVMADILATRTEPLERRFLDALYRDLHRAEGELWALARRIDGWMLALGRLPSRPAGELHRRLADLVGSRLAPALAQAGLTALPAGIGAAWHSPAAGAARPFANPRQALQSGFSALVSAVGLLQSVTPAYFADSLERADHEPAFALVLAFLRLFGDTQQHLNGFTQRHTDFFYRDVLGTAPRPARPEQALLAFPAATATDAVAIARGTTVLAATADGAPPAVFRTDADAFASTVRVGALHTLRFERDPLLSPQRELDFVTRIHHNHLKPDPPAETAPASWSLFGQDAAGTVASEPGEMGLIVSSPLLLVREGRRRIELELELRPLGGRSGAGEGAVLGPAQCETWLRADPTLLAAVALGPVREAAAAIVARVPEAERTVRPEHRALFPDDPLYLVFALALIRLADPARPRGFSAPFGRVMARLLLAPDRPPAPAEVCDAVARLIDWLAAAANHVLEGGRDHDSGAAVRALLTDSRAYQYAKYLSDAFTLDLSTGKGWYRVAAIGVAPLEPEARPGGRLGLRIACTLRADAPPIVADPARAAANRGRLPVPQARLLLAPGATLCAYSLLAPFVLTQVEAHVAVKGVRSLKACNELGPVDPTTPFQPFGPAPRLGASFVVGAYEPALKWLESIELRLAWAGLPRDLGGFSAYYQAYGPEWAETPFAAEVEWLVGGQWTEAGDAGGERQPLFGATDAARPLPAGQSIPVAVPAAAEPLPPSLPAADFRFDLSSQGGFARLRLTGPPGAFGHEDYPLLLARSMGRLHSVLRRSEPPPPPYTPLLAGLELDYTARTIIHVTQVPRDLAYRRAEFVDHIGPFGQEQIHPVPLQPEPGLLPRRAADGALYVGLSGTAPGKPVSLLFQMAERARRRRRFDAPAVRWEYWADGAWRLFPANLLRADTTGALMRSGLVTLDLPDDAVEGAVGGGGPSLPGAGYWLRAVSDADPATFPRVARLVANGFSASRVVADGTEPKPLPAGSVWQLERTPPGLGVLAEVRRPTGGYPPEDATRYRARISERLRHRGRAVTYWDYERLVLERFPQVEMVKCFPAMDDDRPGQATPGKVLLVAVPQAAAADAGRMGERRMLDALTLHDIQAALTRLAPAGAGVEVRNAAYDMIQVRGRVRFADEADRGLLLRTLLAELAACLSPWSDKGRRLGFGWRLNAADIQAFIAERDYVRHVSDFAMLMLSVDDHGRYRLADTARPAQTGKEGAQPFRGLSHSVPWSLPLPLHWQALEAMQTADRRPARPAGIGQLGVGTTLVATGQKR